MNEKEFWNFFKDLQRSGKVKMVAGSISTGTDTTDPYGGYMAGHSILPSDYQNLSEKTIVQIGNLLRMKNVAIKTKEVILILLAHQPKKEALIALEKYNLFPDKGLEIFAALALDECMMWNE